MLMISLLEVLDLYECNSLQLAKTSRIFFKNNVKLVSFSLPFNLFLVNLKLNCILK